MYHDDTTSVSPGSKKSFSELLLGEVLCKNPENSLASRPMFDLAFWHVVKSHIESFWRLVLRSENVECLSLTLEDLVRLGTRRFVPSPRQSHGWLYSVQRCCFGSHAYFLRVQ